MTSKEAIFKKMMDELKDAGMWIDWAYDIKEEEPEIAKYLILSAKSRVESGYPECKKMLGDMLGEDEVIDMVMEHFDDWAKDMCSEIKEF